MKKSRFFSYLILEHIVDGIEKIPFSTFPVIQTVGKYKRGASEMWPVSYFSGIR